MCFCSENTYLMCGQHIHAYVQQVIQYMPLVFWLMYNMLYGIDICKTMLHGIDICKMGRQHMFRKNTTYTLVFWIMYNIWHGIDICIYMLHRIDICKMSRNHMTAYVQRLHMFSKEYNICLSVLAHVQHVTWNWHMQNVWTAYVYEEYYTSFGVWLMY